MWFSFISIPEKKIGMDLERQAADFRFVSPGRRIVS